MGYKDNRIAIDEPIKQAKATKAEIIAHVFLLLNLDPCEIQDCYIAKRALINSIKNN